MAHFGAFGLTLAETLASAVYTLRTIEFDGNAAGIKARFFPARRKLRRMELAISQMRVVKRIEYTTVCHVKKKDWRDQRDKNDIASVAL